MTQNEQDEALRYATSLAVSMAVSYPAVSDWEPLPDLLGVLSQIDNMWCGYRDKLWAQSHAT